MTEAERRLVNILKAKQVALDMRDIPFSKHLGISQGHWSLIKHEKRRVGRDFARKIVGRFPELWQDVQDVVFPRETAA